MVFEGYGNYVDQTGKDYRLGFVHGGKNLIFGNKVVDSTNTNIVLLEYYNDDLYHYGKVASATSDTFTYVISYIPVDAAGKMSVRIVEGKGKGQVRAITGRTDGYTATVKSVWDTALDTTSVAAIYYTTGDHSGLLQHINDSYIWGNIRSDGSLVNAVVYVNAWYAGILRRKRVITTRLFLQKIEFWQQRASFTGAVVATCQYRNSSGVLVDTCTTGGVGCGILANRPATCTTALGIGPRINPVQI